MFAEVGMLLLDVGMLYVLLVMLLVTIELVIILSGKLLLMQINVELTGKEEDDCWSSDDSVLKVELELSISEGEFVYHLSLSSDI